MKLMFRLRSLAVRLLDAAGAAPALAALALGSAVALTPAGAGAQSAELPETLGKYRDWIAFRYMENGNPVCFAVTEPTAARLSRTGASRGDVFFLVTNFTGMNRRNEPSVDVGYPLKDGSTVTVEIGASDFEMMVEGQNAWLQDPSDEPKLIDAMKAGSSMTVKGVSARGTRSTDTFSLMGLTDALAKIDSECK